MDTHYVFFLNILLTVFFTGDILEEQCLQVITRCCFVKKNRDMTLNDAIVNIAAAFQVSISQATINSSNKNNVTAKANNLIKNSKYFITLRYNNIIIEILVQEAR